MSKNRRALIGLNTNQADRQQGQKKTIYIGTICQMIKNCYKSQNEL